MENKRQMEDQKFKEQLEEKDLAEAELVMELQAAAWAKMGRLDKIHWIRRHRYEERR